MKIKLHWNPCTEVKNCTSVKMRAVWTAASQHPWQLPSLAFPWLGKRGSCDMFLTFWFKKMLTVFYLYRVNSSHFYLSSRSTLSSPGATLCPNKSNSASMSSCVWPLLDLWTHTFQADTNTNYEHWFILSKPRFDVDSVTNSSESLTEDSRDQSSKQWTHMFSMCPRV